MRLTSEMVIVSIDDVRPRDMHCYNIITLLSFIGNIYCNTQRLRKASLGSRNLRLHYELYFLRPSKSHMEKLLKV